MIDYRTDHTKAPDEMDSFKLKENVFYPKEAICILYMKAKISYVSKTTRYRGLFDCFRVLITRVVYGASLLYQYSNRSLRNTNLLPF